MAFARGRILPIAFVGATFSAIPFSLIAFASLTLPTGFAALLNAATPIFTALVGAAWIGHRLTGRAFVGMGIGVFAVLVLVGWSPLPLGPATILAVAAALGAALSYAVAGTWVRRRLSDMSGIEVATGQLVTGAMVLLPFAILSGAPGVPGPDGIASLVAVAIFSTALAWPIFFRVSSHTTPTAASTVTFIVPAFGITWGALVLGEHVGVELIAGFALVMVSLVLVLGIRLPVGTVMAHVPGSASGVGRSRTGPEHDRRLTAEPRGWGSRPPRPAPRDGLHEADDVSLRIGEQGDRRLRRDLGERHEHSAAALFDSLQRRGRVIGVHVERHTPLLPLGCRTDAAGHLALADEAVAAWVVGVERPPEHVAVELWSAVRRHR